MSIKSVINITSNSLQLRAAAWKLRGIRMRSVTGHPSRAFEIDLFLKVMVWKEVREGDWQVAMRDEGHQVIIWI